VRERLAKFIKKIFLESFATCPQYSFTENSPGNFQRIPQMEGGENCLFLSFLESFATSYLGSFIEKSPGYFQRILQSRRGEIFQIRGYFSLFGKFFYFLLGLFHRKISRIFPENSPIEGRRNLPNSRRFLSFFEEFCY